MGLAVVRGGLAGMENASQKANSGIEGNSRFILDEKSRKAGKNRRSDRALEGARQKSAEKKGGRKANAPNFGVVKNVEKEKK
jgi:hypothetical protein